MQRLEGVKEKRDHYSGSLAALGSQCSVAQPAMVAGSTTVARSTMLGLSMTEGGTRSVWRRATASTGFWRLAGPPSQPECDGEPGWAARRGLCTSVTLTASPGTSGQCHPQRL